MKLIAQFVLAVVLLILTLFAYSLASLGELLLGGDD